MRKNTHDSNITFFSEYHFPLSCLIGNSIEISKKLAKIGIYTTRDLLLHFPLRYENRTRLSKIRELIIGIYATIQGKILTCNTNFHKRRIMTCQISDGSGILTVKFFNFSTIMKNNLVSGRFILVYGKTKRGQYGRTEMIHPEYHVKKNSDSFKLENTLTPIYQTTKGIKQVTLRKLIEKSLNLLNRNTIVELLPPKFIHGMMTLPEALQALHFPSISSIEFTYLSKRKHPAQQRLIFEELLAHNLSILALRENMKCFHAQPLFAMDNLKSKFLASLPFVPTNAQIRVVNEIEKDMTFNIPMMRLVQGDVGSGKTLVAALAALRAISHGKQVALMVPTELLAEQHTDIFRNWFSPFGIKVGQLTGKQSKKIYFSQKENIADGKTQMVVGTHAIFQKNIKFHNLALIIIDEQHRFGVHQRFNLWRKGVSHKYCPHQLIMTATPIPRTLAMTIYAGFDTSIIDEIPPGRSPVTTVIIPSTRRSDIIDRIRYVCTKKDRQAYWVCTLIKESDALRAQAAKATWEELQLILPELNIGLVHGHMKSYEKQEVIQRFRKGYLHLLVSTTVIEVGMDVPNSSLMIIENSERLGLSQLHQLRGRIGRGPIQSYCVLLYKSPLSTIAKKRLQIFRENNDGFTIAQKDLEIRGPGDLLGTRQTGNLKFKIADLFQDQEVIPKVQRIAQYIHKYYPKQATALINRWTSKNNHYFSL